MGALLKVLHSLISFQFVSKIKQNPFFPAQASPGILWDTKQEPDLSSLISAPCWEAADKGPPWARSQVGRAGRS